MILDCELSQEIVWQINCFNLFSTSCSSAVTRTFSISQVKCDENHFLPNASPCLSSLTVHLTAIPSIHA